MRERRSTSFFIFISFAFGILVIRLAGLQLISAQTYRRLAKENYVKPVVIEAPRGIIYDRNGKVLADNVPSYTLTIDSIKVTNEEYKELDALFSDSIQYSANNYVMKKIPFKLVCKIEERREKFPNVYVRARPLRRYPYSGIFSHLIGYVSEISKEEIKLYQEYRLGTTIGKSGIEKQYEKFLKGKDGTRYIEVDAKGREQGLLSSVSPEAGCDVWLNIDAKLQIFAYGIMPDKGACVAMNPTNGEVLLWVSKPGFEPNFFPSGISSDIWNGWKEDPLSPLLDRVEKGLFPPASIFKLVTCATALEQGIIAPGTYQLVGCTGSIQIGSRKFDCWKTHGSLNLMDAIIQSCDVYFYQLGIQLGVEAIAIQSRKVGFGDKTGVDMPGELSGFIPSEKWYDKKYGKGRWGKGLCANIAVGQGEILVTPLQILYFISGIANKGNLCSPRIVRKVITPAGEEIPLAASNFNHIPWKRETIEILRKGMLGVVTADNGTGRLASVPGIEVAGKTGTAQNPTGETHAWFAAFAPYENPQICIVVFVEHGGMGGSVAAPIAGKILKKFFGYEVDVGADASTPVVNTVLEFQDTVGERDSETGSE